MKSQKRSPKRPYSCPTLNAYGTMVALTKGGMGSCGVDKKKSHYWECDDD